MGTVVVWTLVTIQIVLAVALILIIATQTTKSEQSGGGGMGGWGTIGGHVSSSISKFGHEAQLTRLTTIIAIAFFVVSLLSATAGSWLIPPH